VALRSPRWTPTVYWMRARVWGIVVMFVAAMLVVTGEAGATTNPIRTCGFIRASVPYSHAGHHYRWRVYVRGAASCASVSTALNAVTHLRAKAHVGNDTADSYFTFGRWRCDFGQMGAQACWQPARKPYRSQGLALNCSTADGGCPVHIADDYLPATDDRSGAAAGAADLTSPASAFAQPTRLVQHSLGF
jgi:hypothetical protein